MQEWKILGKTLEYDDETHTYIYEGIVLPSVTQIMKLKFGGKYDNVKAGIVRKAAKKGTMIHQAIEKLCQEGEVEDFKEVRNFRFLQKHYGFKVIDNEIPIVLFKDDVAIAAGKIDLVLDIDDEIYLSDIKRTAVLDKEYLAYQLNLYRIGYQQCYGQKVVGLRGMHLRDDKRKFIPIPINEEKAWELVEEYMRSENEEEGQLLQ